MEQALRGLFEPFAEQQVRDAQSLGLTNNEMWEYYCAMRAATTSARVEASQQSTATTQTHNSYVFSMMTDIIKIQVPELYKPSLLSDFLAIVKRTAIGILEL